MLAEYEAPPIDPAIDEAMREFIDRQESVDAGRELLMAVAPHSPAKRGEGEPLRERTEYGGSRMRTHARAVVIGGGVVGVSTLYHLAKKGWTDSVLLERKELTSGSTWHAAGLLPLFNLSYSVGQMHKYSVALYKTLEKETGLDVGFRQVSNIRLARTQDRLDEYKYYAGVAATIGGIEVEVPHARTRSRKSGRSATSTASSARSSIPQDGYIQPADLTQALARGARERGAEINRNTTVTAIERAAERRMEGRHRQGRNRLRARDLGDRQFRAEDRPHGRDQRAGHSGRASIYRHRGASRDPGAQGARACRKWACCANPIPPGTCARRRAGCCSGLMRSARRPAMSTAHRRTANTSCSRKTSSGSRRTSRLRSRACRLSARSASRRSTTAPSPIRRTARRSSAPRRACATSGSTKGHSFGVTAAGGAGWQLAEWIVEGEPSVDMLGVDPRRFGPYAQPGYLEEKNEEAYAKVFTVHYPNEERAAARPLRQTPCYDRHEGARRRVRLGLWLGAAEFLRAARLRLERGRARQARRAAQREPSAGPASGRARNGASAAPTISSSSAPNAATCTRTSACRTCRPSPSSKCRGRAPKRGSNSILTNKIPKAVNRVTLTYLLTERGGVRAEFTLTRIGPERFYLVSAGALETHDYDSLEKLLPADGRCASTR